MPDDELNALAKRLYDIRDSARIIDFAEAEIEGVWKPDPKYCHATVSTWVAHNPGWTVVRGWAVFDFTNNPFLTPSRFHFAAHSVVCDPEGTLWDITPSLASQAYPFIRHPGTNEEFEDIVTRRKLEAVDYIIA